MRYLKIFWQSYNEGFDSVVGAFWYRVAVLVVMVVVIIGMFAGRGG